MIITERKLSQDQIDDYHQAMKRLADMCSLAPIPLIKQYQEETKPLLDGTLDSLLFSNMPIEEARMHKVNRQFFSDLGQYVILVRERVKQYMIDTGQMK